MKNFRMREEVINSILTRVISKLGVSAEAETIQVHGEHRPDVIFQLKGLRVVIEGKFSDAQNARKSVLADAKRRVNAGIAHLAVAVVYPKKMRTIRTENLSDALIETQLDFLIVSETFESDQWFKGNPATIMESLRRAQVSLSEDNIVELTAKSLSVHLEQISSLWSANPGVCDRLGNLLGIEKPANEDKKEAHDRRTMSAKIGALVIASAFIFQEQLSFSDERVETLQKLKKSENLIEAISGHWVWVWENINYVPIFQLGEKIVVELPAGNNTAKSLKSLMGEAQSICAKQAALRHDLMGRIFHWLLHNAKYLGTYYTSVSSATLLLKVALEQNWEIDFGSPRQIADFKIGDLACGTGTLLMASAQSITDNFIKRRLETNKNVNDKDLAVLHSTLMQNIIHGYDILPSAVHLTASTLALLAPEVAFRQMNLYVMPMGLDHGIPRLGSLDFLDGNEVHTQFSIDDTHLETVRTSAAKSTQTNAIVPNLDLCVMNPPFVSSRYGNKLFGSLPEVRKKLQKTLSMKSRKLGISATAGLGALFVPLAEMHTKPGGRIAFVLPIALATGEAWGPVRNFISQKFHLEVVITSHDPLRNNFSENTSLSEILFIARKLKRGEKSGKTAYFSLWKNPTTIYSALELSSRISNLLQSESSDNSIFAINSGSNFYGEMTSNVATYGDENWTHAIFAHGILATVFAKLNKESVLETPGLGKECKIPLCPLSELGNLGYDVRDIMDAFEVDKNSKTWTPYPGFWNHDAERVLNISQSPNAMLSARIEPIRGRKAKDPNVVWSKAGKILLVSRLWPITHKVIAIGFDKKVLGNTWWAFDDSKLNETQRKALLLWLNSTLGILLYFGRRAITRGAWMQMKKPAWQSMPVLDVLNFSKDRLSKLAKTYDQLAEKSLCPISQLDSDSLRKRIDKSIEESLNLLPIEPIQELLTREPGLTGKPISTDGS